MSGLGLRRRLSGAKDAIGDECRRSLVAWAAASRQPDHELVRNPPFGEAEAPKRSARRSASTASTASPRFCRDTSRRTSDQRRFAGSPAGPWVRSRVALLAGATSPGARCAFCRGPSCPPISVGPRPRPGLPPSGPASPPSSSEPERPSSPKRSVSARRSQPGTAATRRLAAIGSSRRSTGSKASRWPGPACPARRTGPLPNRPDHRRAFRSSRPRDRELVGAASRLADGSERAGWPGGGCDLRLDRKVT